MATERGPLTLEIISDSDVRIAQVDSKHPLTLMVHRERALWRFSEERMSPDEISYGKELVAAFLRWKRDHPRIFSMMKRLAVRK